MTLRGAPLLLGLLVLARQSAWPAQQFATRLSYDAEVIYDRDGKVVTLDRDEIKGFDCAKLSSFVTIFEGSLKVDAVGSYVMEVNTTRLFGRKKDGAEGAQVNFAEDDNECKEPKKCGHEHIVGNFFRGKGCYNELRLPGRPAHSTAQTKQGADLAATVKAGGMDSQVIDVIVSVAQAQENAPTDDDFARVYDASKDRLLKSLVDPCFMQRLGKFDRAKRQGDDNAAAALEAACAPAPQASR
jgi:hypothetical protein